MMVDFNQPVGDGRLSGLCLDALAASLPDESNPHPWWMRSMLAVRIQNATEAIFISEDEAAVLASVLPDWQLTAA